MVQITDLTAADPEGLVGRGTGQCVTVPSGMT